MPQVLTRLPNGLYQITDSDLAIVCTETTSLGSPELIGLAFLTRSSGWRVLRYGLADIGYTVSATDAVARILEDAERHGPRKADLPESIRRAIPVALAGIVAAFMLFATPVLAVPPPAPAYTLVLQVDGEPITIEGTYPDRAACEAAGRGVLQDGRHRRPGQLMTFTCVRQQPEHRVNVIDRCGVGGSKCVPENKR